MTRVVRFAAIAALALITAPVFAEAAPVVEHHAAAPWLGVVASLGGLVLGLIQLIVGLSLAAFSITKGLQVLSGLLGGLDIWAQIKQKNVAVALLAAGVVISYTRVISGGIDSMTKSLLTLGSDGILNGAIGLISGLINLAVAIMVASFAITVVFKVMDNLTKDIDEKTEFANGNVAIGVVYCGILIGVSGLVAAGVSGIGSGISILLSAIVRLFI